VRGKILLTSRWLVADADLMSEKSTAGWLADQLAEQADGRTTRMSRNVELRVERLFYGKTTES
jgi:hypothetical protein